MNPRRARILAILLFVGAAFLMVVRRWGVFVAPRLLAEEGVHFFEHAYHHGFFESLTYVYFHASYLNLITNFATSLAAHTVSLEYAPAVTTGVALVVQLVPLAFLVTGDSELFPGVREKAIGCVIVCLAPTAIGGIWLTSLHSQVFLGLAAILILFEQVNDASFGRRCAYTSTLIIGGLSGVYTVLLQPVFLIRAILEGGRERWIQAALVSCLLITQILVVTSQESLHPHRSVELGIDVAHAVTSISVLHIGAAVIGPGLAEFWADATAPGGGLLFLLLFLVSSSFTLVDWKTRRLRLRDPRLILVLTLAALATVTSSFALQGKAGARYAVLSGCLVLFYVLAGIRATQHRWRAIGLGSLLTISLIAGVYTHWDPNRFQCDGKDWAKRVDDWRHEPARAALYKREPSKQIAVCPDHPPWLMELDQALEDSR